MMKLFYSAGSCSTSCHIGLEEAGVKHTAIELDFDKPDANLAEMERLNPLKVVPVLVTEQGKIVTQNAAILEMIADQNPASKLLPPPGTQERAEATAWLSFVAADLHKAFSPLFMIDTITSNEPARGEVRAWATKNVTSYLAYMDQHLAGKDYLMGKQFTVADCYAFVVVNWGKWVKVPTDSYKNLNSYITRVYQRPAVQKVMKIEGLLD